MTFSSILVYRIENFCTTPLLKKIEFCEVTTMGGEKVGIVGASIAGCAASCVLQRCGYRVEVFEKRGPEEMHGLGAGLVLPEDLILKLKKE